MKTIFAATDYSEIGNNAVRYAISYAQTLDADVIVFHTGPAPKFNPTITEEEFNKLEQLEEQKNIQQLNNLINKFFDEDDYTLGRSKVQALARTSIIIADTIVAQAKKYEADLIVIGTHGKTALQLFGGTSTTVILQSKTPVLAIPPAYRFKAIETITYASDFMNLGNELKKIVPFAKPSGALLEILHLDMDEKNKIPDVLLKELESQIKYDKLKLVVELEVKGLTLTEQIEIYVQSSDSDMLVMFPENRNYFDRLFGAGKTEKMAYKIQLPLLTFRKKDVAT